jgi:hypothetical protein
MTKHVTINDIVVVCSLQTGIIDWPKDDDMNPDETSLQWYSPSDVKEFRRHATIALSAINQSCGDFDLENTIAQHSKSVLAEQDRQRQLPLLKKASPSSLPIRDDENASFISGPQRLATLASQSSKGSMEMARFYALVLEQEVRDASVITLDVVSSMVNKIFFSNSMEEDCDCKEKKNENDNEDDDDADTIGTIEEILIPSPPTTTKTNDSNHHSNVLPAHRRQTPIMTPPTLICCFEGGDGGPSSSLSLPRKEVSDSVLLLHEGKVKDWNDKSNKDDQEGAVVHSQSPDDDDDNVSKEIATTTGKRKRCSEDFSRSSTRSFQGDVVSSPLFSPGIETSTTVTPSSFASLFPLKGDTNGLRRQVTIEEETQKLQQQQEEKQKQQRRQASIEEETQTRCNVSYALISLVRWEFRCHEL